MSAELKYRPYFREGDLEIPCTHTELMEDGEVRELHRQPVDDPTGEYNKDTPITIQTRIGWTLVTYTPQGRMGEITVTLRGVEPLKIFRVGGLHELGRSVLKVAHIPPTADDTTSSQEPKPVLTGTVELEEPVPTADLVTPPPAGPRTLTVHA